MRARWLLALLLALAAVMAARSIHGAASHRARPAEPAGKSKQAGDLTRYVDPFVGTFGNGNVFPGATTPFGMVQWSPDTGPSGITRPGGYFYRDAHITGFPLTHLSGAGCVQYDDVPFMPTVRAVTSSPIVAGYPYSARFSHADEVASPGYYRVRLNSGVLVELSATAHTGIARFTYPHGSSASLLLNTGGSAGPTTNRNQATTASVHILQPNTVVGSVTSGHFCGQANTYTLFFSARFNHPFLGIGTWKESTIFAGVPDAVGHHTGAWLRFGQLVGQPLVARVGVSFVNTANATMNLRRENHGESFDVTRARARSTWNQTLSAITATGAPASWERSFYTALYHSYLHPNIFSDTNGQYVGFDARVHNAGSHPQYANYSGWDIYRSQIPLLAWTQSRRASDMMESLVRDAQQGGWLPKWSVANGDSGVMNGDPSDPMLAGAFAFGSRSFDLHAALKAMLKGAGRTGSGQHGLVERPGLADYERLGYLPPQRGAYGSAATTLEYGIDDFAVAQFARSLGVAGEYALLMRRAQAWQHLINPATGFVEPTAADGTFPATFDPRSQSGFVEGNAWQYSWWAPHNIAGLFRAMGGEKQAVRRLNVFLSHLNTNANAPFDWAGNEPALETPWLFDFTNEPWRTQQVVRRIATQLYPATTYGLPGNDDLGEMSSWYVWAAIGLYPEIPGTSILTMAAPLFPNIHVHLANHRDLHIRAPDTSNAPFVGSVRVDGLIWNSSWLAPSVVARGGTVTFRLQRIPNRSWAASAGASPPSFAGGEAPLLGFVTPPNSTGAPTSRSRSIRLMLRNETDRPLRVIWNATPFSGITVYPRSGSITVPVATDAGARVIVDTRNAALGVHPILFTFKALGGPRSAGAIPSVVEKVVVG